MSLAERSARQLSSKILSIARKRPSATPPPATTNDPANLRRLSAPSNTPTCVGRISGSTPGKARIRPERKAPNRAHRPGNRHSRKCPQTPRHPHRPARQPVASTTLNQPAEATTIRNRPRRHQPVSPRTQGNQWAKIAVLAVIACLLMGNMSEGSGHTYNLAGQWKVDTWSVSCDGRGSVPPDVIDDAEINLKSDFNELVIRDENGVLVFEFPMTNPFVKVRETRRSGTTIFLEAFYWSCPNRWAMNLRCGFLVWGKVGITL